MASSAAPSKKLRFLLLPFFATSHIAPFTDLAFHLAAARPDVVEVTIAVTPANASVVRSVLTRRAPSGAATAVKTANYAFPAVDGVPPGVENISAFNGEYWWHINVAAMDEALMRPGQEALIRESSPDVIISDVHFFWNADIAADLGMPCVTYHVIGTFPMLAMFNTALLHAAGVTEDDDGVVTVPHFPPPDIRIPRSELPKDLFLRSQQQVKRDHGDKRAAIRSAMRRSFGLAVNTFLDLEQEYCGSYVADGFVKRAYFLGPLVLPLPQSTANSGSGSGTSRWCIEWLDKKQNNSVLYLCFGTFAPLSDAQLRDLALGLEASGKPFLWVVNSDSWTPPEGWTERVGDRGLVVTNWAPQTMILAHPSVGAFVTHCGWNSVLETVVAGVPVLTWPLVAEQFITERLVTQVLGIGARLCPEDSGLVRSSRRGERDLIPAEVVAPAVAAFMEPGGAGDAARVRAKKLSVKARAAMADGGSSHRDLCRFIDDLVEARAETAQPYFRRSKM